MSLWASIIQSTMHFMNYTGGGGNPVQILRGTVLCCLLMYLYTRWRQKQTYSWKLLSTSLRHLEHLVTLIFLSGYLLLWINYCFLQVITQNTD